MYIYLYIIVLRGDVTLFSYGLLIGCCDNEFEMSLKLKCYNNYGEIETPMKLKCGIVPSLLSFSKPYYCFLPNQDIALSDITYHGEILEFSTKPSIIYLNRIT